MSFRGLRNETRSPNRMRRVTFSLSLSLSCPSFLSHPSIFRSRSRRASFSAGSDRRCTLGTIFPSFASAVGQVSVARIGSLGRPINNTWRVTFLFLPRRVQRARARATNLLHAARYCIFTRYGVAPAARQKLLDYAAGMENARLINERRWWRERVDERRPAALSKQRPVRKNEGGMSSPPNTGETVRWDETRQRGKEGGVVSRAEGKQPRVNTVPFRGVTLPRCYHISCFVSRQHLQLLWSIVEFRICFACNRARRCVARAEIQANVKTPRDYYYGRSGVSLRARNAININDKFSSRNSDHCNILYILFIGTLLCM